MGSKTTNESILADIASVCNLDSLAAIEDVYPCTPLQVGIMAQPFERVYVNCVHATLGPSVNADEFCHALGQIYRLNPVLRTRIVNSEPGLVQVVVKGCLSIARPSLSLVDALEGEKSASMGFGTPLFRAALLGRSIILTTHHAISDGGTYARLFDSLSRVYRGLALPPHANFRLFVKHCLSINENAAVAFWAPRFRGLAAVFPPIAHKHIPDASRKLEAHFSFDAQCLNVPIGLMSCYVETAWAITAMSYANSESVIFGRVLSGRVSGLSGGLESTLGPTIVTMPVQANLSRNATIADMIKERAQERREALQSPVLQYGLVRIRNISEAARTASRFTTLLNFRTPTDDGRDYKLDGLLEIDGEYDAHLPYGLGISIILQERGLVVEMLFDDKMICVRQAQRILGQFEHILATLMQSPAGTRLARLPLLNAHDRREILGWNNLNNNTQAPQETLHSMFRGVVRAQPSATAVDGPEGRLTYRELDVMTDALAHELGRCGLGSEDVVALVFDKSIYTIVAQLGVLKAGAVCAPIDPGFPVVRKDAIMSKAGVKMILSSDPLHVANLGIKVPIMVIDSQLVSRLQTVESTRDVGVDVAPSQAAFILFTSGSTGTPKGHILEHRNLASSLTTIGRTMGWGPGVRMLQFAAYVWDMSIAETVGTLISGGCVCVPSEEARESAIEEYITSRQVNCAIFTPTVLRMITPEGSPSLRSIMSIGEPVDPESVDMWSGHTRFFNAWGPSETSCVSSMAELTLDSPYRGSIGRPLASALWLVDEKNVDRLVPIGSIGEIVVESAGVARGYIDDPRQTAAAFITSPPSWAPPRKASSSPCRMYRTGDLARYNPDGSLEFIGRVDNQVKIHGQRVELGEVEKALGACSAVRYAFTALQGSSSSSSHHGKDLVAVVTLEEPRLPTRTALQEMSPSQHTSIQHALEDITAALADRLPQHMIPTVWRVVEDFPRTASWKIDRKSIEMWIAQWTPHNDDKTVRDRNVLTPPISPTERCLQITWALVLGRPEDEIGRESSFIQLGGDSLLAMKVATQCRKRGIQVSIAMLLQSRNLAAVAAASRLVPGHPSIVNDEGTDKGKSLNRVSCSPFQQLLLQDGGVEALPATSTARWRIKTDRGAHITADRLERALIQLLEHHPMTRSRFEQHDDGTSTQLTVVPVSKVVVRVRTLDSSESPNPNDPASVAAGEIALFADLIHGGSHQSKTGGSPILVLTTSCLVDEPSWQIIRQDLDSILQGPQTMADFDWPSTPSFADWIQVQSNGSQLEEAADTTRAGSESWRRTLVEYWSLTAQPSIQNRDGRVEHDLDIDSAVTDALFGASCNRPFNTNPIELLLASVVLSFRKKFPDRHGPALYSLHDGRRNHICDDEPSRFSRTVGNFSTMIHIDSSLGMHANVQDAVIMVKESYRAGVGHGSVALSACMAGPQPLSRSDVEVLFSLVDIDTGDDMEEEVSAFERCPHLGSFGLVRIHARRRRQGGKLSLSIHVSYPGWMAHQQRILSWVSSLKTTLTCVADQTPHFKPQFTWSEDPLGSFGSDHLAGIQSRLAAIGIDTPDVQVVLPCSPVQEGILLSQLKSPNDQRYMMTWGMKLCSSPVQDELDLARIKEVWQAVCLAEPILRTLFISYDTGSGGFQQVILKSPAVSVSTEEMDADLDPEQASVESIMETCQAPPSLTPVQPPHHIHFITTVSPRTVYAVLSIHHALFDERSLQLIGKKLAQAYAYVDDAHHHLPRGRTLSSYLAWVAKHRSAAIAYWKGYLAGIQPCSVPTLDLSESLLMKDGSGLCEIFIPDGLAELCRNQGITVANLMQVAWGLVLSLLTGCRSLCFGYLHSHEASVQGGESLLGPLLSMAFHRYDATGTMTVTQLLERAQQEASRALEQGACSLSDLLDAFDMRGQVPLFNTIMTIFRLSSWPEKNTISETSDGHRHLRIEHTVLRGKTEYAMTVGIGYDRDTIVAKLLYDTSRVAPSLATKTATMFTQVVSQMVSNTAQSVQTLMSAVEKPTTLYLSSDIAKTALRKAASQCEMPSSLIEDVHPCTPLQRQQMEATCGEMETRASLSSLSLDQYVFDLTDLCPSADRLNQAWKLVTAACPPLRTRVVSLLLGQDPLGSVTCQITLKTASDCVDGGDSLSEYLQWDKESPPRYGRPLSRLARVQEPHGAVYMVLSLYPAIYDPWTLALVLQRFTEVLLRSNDTLVPLISLAAYARSLSNRCQSTIALDNAPGLTPSLTQFPAVPPDSPTPKISSSRRVSLRGSLMVHVLHAAWALVLSRVTGENHVRFGFYVEGRSRGSTSAQPDNEGIVVVDQVAGPVGAVVAFDSDLGKTPTVGAILQAAERFTNNKCLADLHYRHAHAASAEGERNVLIVDSSPVSVLPFLEPMMIKRAASFCNARLTVYCRVMEDNTTTVTMEYDELVLSHQQVDLLLEQYKHAAEQLASPPASSTPLAHLPPLSGPEMTLLQAWNKDMPPAEEVCVHDQIRTMSQGQPAADAICSWDGELSHGQLDDLSNRTATWLQIQGVGPGSIVACFLDKSTTAVVVMLAILKAGGALVQLDIKHPASRIQLILSETAASKMVISAALEDKFRALKLPAARQDTVMVVDMPRIMALPPCSSTRSPVQQYAAAKSSDTCYIVYTSGSTGKPQGIVVTHSSLATSIKYARGPYKADSNTRALQYLNFIFDLSIFDVFLTLTCGGCVCLPSPEEWSSDMAGAIRRTRVNLVCLTPSLATLLEPAQVPMLKTLALGGEPCDRSTIDKWRGVHVVNIYGPAEATVSSSTADISFGSGRHHLNIGRPGGCVYWVVSAADHNQLVPIGCPGELLIQGPIVSLGYISDPVKTATAFIAPPKWMVSSFPSLDSGSRWYKTGDIVVQAADGSMVYQGRKDTQVKLSGQRIELGEIEHCLRRSCKELLVVWNLVVELIQPADREGNNDKEACLVVFLAASASNLSAAKLVPCELLAPLPNNETWSLKAALAVNLPAYMVPKAFVHVSALPMTASGKTDRAALRRLGKTLSHTTLNLYHPSSSRTEASHLDKMQCGNPAASKGVLGGDMEACLAQLWSKTLDLQVESIKPTDDFFHVGGSSIRAMRLSHAARRAGIGLSTADVFQAPIFLDMAKRARMAPHEACRIESDNTKAASLSLLESPAFLASCLAHAAHYKEPYLTAPNIENIARSTDVQTDMVAVGELDGEAWRNSMTIDCETGLSVVALTAACKTVIRHHQMLRTVFVQHGDALYQVAIKEVPGEDMIVVGASQSNYHHLPQFRLEELSPSGDLCHRFRLNIHHALYDAISMDMILLDLQRVYAMQSPISRPSFFSHAQFTTTSLPNHHQAASSRSFWKHALAGSSMTYLVPSPSIPATSSPCHDTFQLRVPFGLITAASSDTATPPSSLIQAAWALVLARATNRNDVVFCAPNANRDWPDGDLVCGPCLNYLPARARGLIEESETMTLGQLVRKMHSAAVAALPHQHLGFRSVIMRECTDWPAWTRYGSVVIYQNHESLKRGGLRFGEKECVLIPRGDFGRTADILIEVTPPPNPLDTATDGVDEDLVIDMLFSLQTFTQEQVAWIAHNLAQVLETASQNLDKPLDAVMPRADSLFLPSLTTQIFPRDTPPKETPEDQSDVGAEQVQAQETADAAWAEVGLRLSLSEESMFECGADLVTTMLLARCFQGKGYHQVTMQHLIDHPTRGLQARLILRLDINRGTGLDRVNSESSG